MNIYQLEAECAKVPPIGSKEQLSVLEGGPIPEREFMCNKHL